MRKAIRIVGITLALIAAACSSRSSSTTSPGGGATKLTVFAASSLTGAFTQIGNDFEAANPGTTVDFNFGSSTDLAAQIASEGTADVFASASGKAMDAAQAKPGVTDRTDFATNQLVIVTPANDPAGVVVDPGSRGSPASSWCSPPSACRSATTREKPSRTQASSTRQR